MRVILEGPPRSGKTTLAGMLHTMFPNHHYLKVEYMPRPQSRLQAELYFVLNQPRDYIRDRSYFITDLAMSTFTDKEQSIFDQPALKNFIIDAYHESGVIIVYVRAKPEALMERYRKLGIKNIPGPVPIEEFSRKIYESYERIMTGLSERLNVITIETTKSLVNDSFISLVKKLTLQEARRISYEGGSQPTD